ncbi:MAG: hypothetical protein BroJett040_19120 [Oligoflexia bacterium]|nr:MAG: hypothetical protein BroJett040_19120 [Oligoflexia bacterium]
MEWIVLFSRILLGTQLLFWGLNGFFHFYPLPKQSEKLERFIQTIVEVGFIMPFVKVTEIIGGLFLIFDLYVLVTLFLLGPIIFVICIAQYRLNFQKGWTVILGLSLPYLVIFFSKVNLLTAFLDQQY